MFSVKVQPCNNETHCVRKLQNVRLVTIFHNCNDIIGGKIERNFNCASALALSLNFSHSSSNTCFTFETRVEERILTYQPVFKTHYKVTLKTKKNENNCDAQRNCAI